MIASGVGTQNATWCSRGPRPLVKAMSCTPPLRCIHAAHSRPVAASSVYSVTRKPMSFQKLTALSTFGEKQLKWSIRSGRTPR